MNPKVSILVPIYNVSAYIEKCAISLFEQTFQDVEYIFVNDATPDNSIEILLKVLESYPKRSKQTNILHHSSNQGLAVSRKTALFAAQGEYIAVIDSDDYIDNNMIEEMYNRATAEQADIVVSDIIFEYPGHELIIHEQVPENKSDYLKEILINKTLRSFLCDKLVRRDLYLHPECIIPDGQNYYEDRYVMTRLCFFANKISKVDKAFYHYIQYNQGAITKNKSEMHFKNLSRFWSDLDVFLKEKNIYNTYKELLEIPKLESKVSLMIGVSSSSLRKKYRDLYYEEEGRHIKHFKRGERLMILLIRNRMFLLANIFHHLIVIKNRQ